MQPVSKGPDPMPQMGIFAQGLKVHHFIEFDLTPKATPRALSLLVKNLTGVSSGKVNVVVGFGTRVWRELAPTHAPAELGDFKEVIGPGGRKAPAAQHDIWVWIGGGTQDETWDAARAARLVLDEVASVAVEQPGFTYRENRDLLGFQDGTGNPPPHQAPEVALVPRGQPGEMGSHVLVMRWLHDLAAFNRLSTSEQEGVFGRTKRDSVEIREDVRPPTAHVSRMTVKAHGEELKIYRRSVPFGDAREPGLCFVAFSADPTRYDVMLSRMFGTSGDGVRDRLLEFTRTTGGAKYFAPSVAALAETFD